MSISSSGLQDGFRAIAWLQPRFRLPVSASGLVLLHSLLNLRFPGSSGASCDCLAPAWIPGSSFRFLVPDSSSDLLRSLLIVQFWFSAGLSCDCPFPAQILVSGFGFHFGSAPLAS